MNLKKTWPILKEAGQEFSRDKVLRLSAALAYYAMFSIGPILVIAVGVAGLVFGHDAVRQQIQQQLQSMLGESAARTISSMMASQKQGTSIITAVVGVVALLVGAGGVFGQLQDSLNTIWEVKPKPGTGFWSFLRARFLSFSMVLGVGFLLLVSMALSTALSALTNSLGGLLPMPPTLAQALNFIVSFAVISLLFAMIFRFLPDIKIPFRKVWVGAIGTALLFTIGKHLLSLYLGRAATASTYGAAGSVILILMWVYYASTILFFGAEFTQVYARHTGTRVVARRYAEPVTAEDRAQEGIPHDQPVSGAAHTGVQPYYPRPARPHSPGAVVHERPGQFVGLMLVAGFAGAALATIKPLRKALKLYLVFRRA